MTQASRTVNFSEPVINKRISSLQNKVEALKLMVLQRDMIAPHRHNLVALAIKRTLREIGEGEYHRVVQALYFEHNCELTDCYDNPEYLKAILQRIFGNSHKAILASVRENLEAFSSEEHIQQFLTNISR